MNSENAELGGDEHAGLEPLDAEAGPARPLSELQAAALTDRMLRQLHPVSRGSSHKHYARLLVVVASATTAVAAAAYYGTDWFVGPRPSSPADEGGERRSPPAHDPAVPALLADPNGRPIEAPAAPTDADDLRSVARHSAAAADHLSRANALRGEHRFREAHDLYLHVVQQFPHTLQARAAQLAAADIRLEQFRDIAGAESLYRAAQGPGALSAEADFGLAEVARARGDRAAELRALGEFLARHAGHPLEAAAERRMKALEAP